MVNIKSLLVAGVVLALLVAPAGIPSVGTVVSDVVAQETTDNQENQSDGPPVVTWTQTYGGPRDDRGALVVPVADGYLIAGTTRSFGQASPSRADLWLVRIDGTGQEQWTRPYGTGSDEAARALLVTDEGYLLVGEIGTAEGAELYGLDDSGELRWSRIYGVGTAFGDAVPRDDGYLLVGQQTTGEGSQPAALFTIDREGRIVESQRYVSRSAAKERFTDVIETANGTLLVVGESERGEDNTNAWAVELTPDGEQLWINMFGTPSLEVQTTAVVELPDGDYLLVGTQTRNRVSSGMVARLDRTTGDLHWRRTYDAMTFEDLVVDDNGVLLAGSYREGRSTTTDALVLALDGQGRERWRQTYGGDGNEVFAAIEPNETGHLLVGWTSSGGANRDDVYAVAVEPRVHARDLTTSMTNVDPGQTVRVSATVVNRDDQRRSYQATLRVDGESRETKPVVIPPGEERPVSFQLSFDEPGSYAVGIGGLTPVEVTVAAPQTPTSMPEQTPTATPMPTPTPEPTSSPTPASTTETTSPGFGVEAALLSSVLVTTCLWLVLRRRRRN